MGIAGALHDRIVLLRESDQIDSDVADFLAWALQEIERRTGMEVSEATFGTLCTHTALALQRARNGDQVESWHARHEELRDFPWATELGEEIAGAAETRLGVSLSRPERDFIALHLAAASQRQK
jgi:transcriptional antiterminator